MGLEQFNLTLVQNSKSEFGLLVELGLIILSVCVFLHMCLEGEFRAKKMVLFGDTVGVLLLMLSMYVCGFEFRCNLADKD